MIPEIWKPENAKALAEQQANMLIAGRASPLPEVRAVQQLPHLVMLMYHLSGMLVREQYSYAISSNRRNNHAKWPSVKVTACISNCRLLQNAIDEGHKDSADLLQIFELQFRYLRTVLTDGACHISDICEPSVFHHSKNVLEKLRRTSCISGATALDDDYWIKVANDTQSIVEGEIPAAESSDAEEDASPPSTEQPLLVADPPMRRIAVRSNPSAPDAKHVAHTDVRLRAKSAQYRNSSGVQYSKTIARRSQSRPYDPNAYDELVPVATA